MSTLQTIITLQAPPLLSQSYAVVVTVVSSFSAEIARYGGAFTPPTVGKVWRPSTPSDVVTVFAVVPGPVVG